MRSNKCKLGDIITQRREKNNGENLPICGVTREGFIPPKQKDADTSLYNVFYKKDFVFNPARMELNSIVYNNVYEKAICSSLYEVFYVNRPDIVLPEFLALIVKQNWFTRYCEFLGSGSAREYCRVANISQIEINYPSLEEQRKIVNAYQTITDRIALKRKINENLEATAQAILLKAISSNQVSKMKLDDLVEFIDGDRGKNYPTFNEFEPEGFCLFLNATNVTPLGFNFETCMFVTEEKDKAMKKGHLSPFDIVLTSRGTLGNVALYDNNVPYKNVRINSGMLIIRPKTARVSPYFIFALLKSKYMKAAIEQFRSGSAQPQLPIKDLQKISFDVPDDSTILKITDIQLRSIYEIISKNRYETDKLKSLSKILLAKLS